MFSAALLGLSSGCVNSVSESQASVGTEAPISVYVERGVAGLDDYVYYPAYQVYYSSERRQFVYLKGRSWVSRPIPPHVAAEVLFASPSVSVPFHDSPANHHAEIVKQYPKQWAPPGRNRDQHESGHTDDKGQN